jgi:hypothetical protein
MDPTIKLMAVFVIAFVGMLFLIVYALFLSGKWLGPGERVNSSKDVYDRASGLPVSTVTRVCLAEVAIN